MPFEPTDRVVLDTVLDNTESIAAIAADVAMLLASQAVQATASAQTNGFAAIAAGQAAQATAVVQADVLQQIMVLLAGQGQQATAAVQATQTSLLQQILNLLNGIFRPVSKPVRLSLGFPTFTNKLTGEVEMATLPMLDTQVAHIPIMTLNAEGNAVPPPAGDTFTATAADVTQFTAGVSADASGNPQIDVTPMVQVNSAGVMIALTDANGLTAFDFTVTVSRDVKPASDFANLAGVTFTTQPEPTAPGPG